MPFTLSHAAAALPFRKLKPVWPALVIGTLAPDFEYFLRLSDEDRMGHHFPGVLIFSLPLAFLVFWLFVSFVRQPIVELLPLGVQQRLPSPVRRQSTPGWRGFAMAFGWIVCGIATHLAWDWCTHPHTWIWDNWGLLRQHVAIPFHRPVIMNKLVQLASSLFGLAALAAWFANWYTSTAPAREVHPNLTSSTRASIVAIMTGVAFGAGYPLASARVSYLDPPMNPLNLAATTTEAVILLFSIQLLLYGIVRTYVTRPPRQPRELREAEEARHKGDRQPCRG